jgi:hypothetical protein
MVGEYSKHSDTIINARDLHFFTDLEVSDVSAHDFNLLHRGSAYLWLISMLFRLGDIQQHVTHFQVYL